MSPLVHDYTCDMKPVYLGLGGNVGDVLANMAAALQSLDAHEYIRVVAVSGVYKTPPWGITDQDWFLNCCAKIETHITPLELLNVCLDIEVKLKRKRMVRWGPRSVDIDILLFGDIHVDSVKLTIPHPRMHERAFVMLPLSDIAPKLVVEQKRVIDWVQVLDDSDISDVETDGKDWWQQRR